MKLVVLALLLASGAAGLLPASIVVLSAAALPQNPAPGAIAGQVRSLVGEPAAGMRVFAVSAEAPPAGQSGVTISSLTETDSAGRYRLDDLPPGRYHVMAGLISSPTYYPGVATIDAAGVVIAVSGVTAVEVNFTLLRPPGVRVAGRVTDLPEDASARVLVVFQDLGGSPITVLADPDGKFELQAIPPGDYAVHVLVRNQSVSAPSVKVDGEDIINLTLKAPVSFGPGTTPR